MTKLKQKLAEMRAKNAAIDTRMMKVLGQTSKSPRITSSAGGDCSGHSSSDDALADYQQVRATPPPLYYTVLIIIVMWIPLTNFGLQFSFQPTISALHYIWLYFVLYYIVVVQLPAYSELGKYIARSNSNLTMLKDEIEISFR